MAEAGATREKRTFRKYAYRGIDLEKLVPQEKSEATMFLDALLICGSLQERLRI